VSLLSGLKRSWRQLAHGVPGHRFQARYDRAARKRDATAWWIRIASIIVAVLAIAVGIAEIVFPGPAIAFFALGGALLAGQFRPVARFMDWAEVRLRRVIRFLRRCWHNWPLSVRAVVVLMIAGTAVGGAYTTYLVLWR
jgi:hypothetical protein